MLHRHQTTNLVFKTDLPDDGPLVDTIPKLSVHSTCEVILSPTAATAGNSAHGGGRATTPSRTRVLS